MISRNKVFTILLLFILPATIFPQQSESRISITVLDENDNFLTDLKLPDIQFLEEKQALPISAIELKNASSLEVVIMIDASASQEKTLPVEKQVAEYLIDNILKKEKDRVGIVKFSGTLLLEQNLTNDFALAKRRLDTIQFVPPTDYTPGGIVINKTPSTKNTGGFREGATSIWDSVRQVAESLAKLQTDNSRRVIIVISDGINTYGETKLNEAIEFSLKKQIPIFSIGIGDEFYGGVDKEVLNNLSEQTGGISIFPNKKLDNLSKIMKRLEQSLRSFYQITFVPKENKLKKNSREIKIEIVKPQLRKRKLQIFPRKIYFLP
ncbi:MAG TPA: VWA domain-containing protein [Pyrinomonadaceae bacterium]|nr:VWA domain-containing protein [Pyrinomonadaceae bacterium]